jgi:hypothetical protein
MKHRLTIKNLALKASANASSRTASLLLTPHADLCLESRTASARSLACETTSRVTSWCVRSRTTNVCHIPHTCAHWQIQLQYLDQWLHPRPKSFSLSTMDLQSPLTQQQRPDYFEPKIVTLYRDLFRVLCSGSSRQLELC